MNNYEIFQEGLQIAYKKGYEGDLDIAYAEAYTECIEGYKEGAEMVHKMITS